MKVAIVHYWLVGMRGGERVVEELLTLYPDAVIITNVYDPTSVSERIRAAEVRETFVGHLPLAKTHYQKYLPLMPRALEQVDMAEFDLVISSESGPAKGIIPRPDAIHLCYCHSPMRYLWDQYQTYRSSAGWLTRQAMPHIAHRMRLWDVTSAARVDRFIANSNFVAKRIEKYYRRVSNIVHPPVDVDSFAISKEVGEHYLLAGELVPYKRPDLVVDAFTRSGRKLVVIGDGAMRASLEAKAGPSVSFLGRVPFDELKREFSRCRALVFPGVEDFGIVPVEVMASGRPVVAFGRGGACDTIVTGKTGAFFYEQTVEALLAALEELEASPEIVDRPSDIRAHAEQFRSDVFRARFSELVDAAMKVQAIIKV